MDTSCYKAIKRLGQIRSCYMAKSEFPGFADDYFHGYSDHPTRNIMSIVYIYIAVSLHIWGEYREGGIEEKSYTLMAIKTLQETQVFFFSAETCSISPTFWGRTSFIKYSPVAQILADHKNSNEVIKKKLMDWPISSQDPVSCTLKKWGHS